MLKLTDTQLVILSAAAKRDNGSILPLPKKLKIDPETASGILGGFVKKKLAIGQPVVGDGPAWRDDGNGQRLMLIITAAGLRAIGVEPKGDLEADEVPVKRRSRDGRGKLPKSPGAKPRRSWAPRAAPATSTPAARTGSKQAKIIDLLRRRAGASIPELVKATGWQAHSVRGVISGALKKKLGLAVLSEKAESGERRYRIAG